MRPNFIQLLLLWAELKKLFPNRTAGKGRGLSGRQHFKNPTRNRWRLPAILICGLLHFESVTRAQSKPSEVANLGSDAPEEDTQHTNAPTALFSGTNGSGSQLSVGERPFQLVLPRAHLFDDWSLVRQGRLSTMSAPGSAVMARNSANRFSSIAQAS